MKRLRWVLAAALAVRIPGLWGLSWYDENYSLMAARLPFRGMLRALAGDVHPPGWYALLWGVVHALGDAPLWGRLLSLVFSLLAVMVFYRLLLSLNVAERTAWWLTLALALNPFGIYYANEVRMYALLQLLVLLSVWTGVQRRWAWHGLVNAALLWVHNYALFYLPVIGLYLLWRERRLLRGMVLAYALPALSFLPWAVVLYRQMQIFAGGGGHWITQPGPGELVTSLYFWIVGPLGGQFALLGLVITGALLAYAALRPPRDWHVWLWLAAGPLVLSLLPGLVWRPVYLYRGLIGTVPFWLALVGLPLVRTATTRTRAVWLAVFLVPVALAHIVGYYQGRDTARMSEAVLLPYIREHWQAGDVVIATTDGPAVNIRYAAPDLPVWEIPECPGSHDRGALSPPTRDALGIPLAPVDSIPHRRAWVVMMAGPVSDDCRLQLAYQVVGDAEPVVTLKDNGIVYSAMYLLEGTP